MSWLTINRAAVLEQFTPQEQATLKNIQGNADPDSLDGIISLAIAEVLDYIRSGGYDLATDTTTIPQGLHNDAIAIIRWRLLIAFPAMKAMQTPERKEAHDKAVEKLALIAKGEFGVEDPDPEAEPVPRGGTWNSENKILMRTHPVPRPGPSVPNHYANPDGTADHEAES